MMFSVQTDNFNLLKEAVTSSCDRVRFGSEFCEWKIPSSEELEEAIDLVISTKKVFSYITPRTSNTGLEKIRKHLDILSKKGKIDVIVNDLGVLNILSDYSTLKPHLGRQLVYTPARCPWLKMSPRHFPIAVFALKTWMRYITDIYSQTNLLYPPTIQFYRSLGINNVDVDWIPRCFPGFKFLTRNGLGLSIHLQLVPAAITRKCHTARFLGEKIPEECSRPCDSKALLIKKAKIDLELFLHGNVLFSLIPLTEKDVKKIPLKGIFEFIVTMNPVTQTLKWEKIDEIVSMIRTFVPHP